VRDYSTKIACTQKNYFPETSVEDLHMFVTEFFAENPHAIHADFFLLPPTPSYMQPSPSPKGFSDYVMTNTPVVMADVFSSGSQLYQDQNIPENSHLWGDTCDTKIFSPVSFFLRPEVIQDSFIPMSKVITKGEDSTREPLTTISGSSENKQVRKRTSESESAESFVHQSRKFYPKPVRKSFLAVVDENDDEELKKLSSGIHRKRQKT